jgi:hypothetical protein
MNCRRAFSEVRACEESPTNSNFCYLESGILTTRKFHPSTLYLTSNVQKWIKQDEDGSVEQVDTIQIQNFEFGEKRVNLKGVDDALMFTVDREPITWTAEEERKLLWKIDLRLIPLVRLSWTRS